MSTPSIPTVPFGRSDRQVTRVGLGGEGVLRTMGRTPEASEVIRAARAAGIGYFDSARVYAESERYYGAVWGVDPAGRASIFQASKSAARGRTGAAAELEQSLQRLQTDHLDLWQIHDIRTARDIAMIEEPGGALEAFVEARASGRVRFIGVTGHRDPEVLAAAVERWPVDAVMMPVNPVEGILGGFLTETLAAARAKGVAVIAMKVLGASHHLNPALGITAERLIRYALAQPVTVAIVGCADPLQVKVLAEAGRDPNPMPPHEIAALHDLFRPHASRLAYYRGVG